MVDSIHVLFHTLSLQWKMQQLGWEAVFSTLLCKQSGSCKKTLYGQVIFGKAAYSVAYYGIPVGAASVLLGLRLASLAGCTALGE